MIPYYIFEDRDDSNLSVLLRASYSELYKSGHLKFAEGNGGFEKILEQLISTKSKDQTYVVCIDLVPDNEDTERAYKELRRFARDHDLFERICVLPIICAEYYFAKAFHDTFIEENAGLVKYCLSLQVHYGDADAIKMDRRVKYKSFEWYCKFVQKHGFHSCVVSDSRGHGLFMKENCPCQKPDCLLEANWTVLDKSIRYVLNYPVAPPEVDLPDLYKGFLFCTFDDMKSISRGLCDLYNNRLNAYKTYCQIHNKPREFGEGIEAI